MKRYHLSFLKNLSKKRGRKSNGLESLLSAKAQKVTGSSKAPLEISSSHVANVKRQHFVIVVTKRVIFLL